MFDHTQLKVYHRNGLIPYQDASVALCNLSLLYGLSVFTGMRAHKDPEGHAIYLFRPRDHYRRLVRQCRLVDFKNFEKEYSYERFEEILKLLFRENAIEESAYIRVSLFLEGDSIVPKFSSDRDSLSIFLYPLGDYVSVSGIRCMTSTWVRVQDSMLPARGKIAGSYVNTALAKSEAVSNGYDDAIFTDGDGHVIEASAANLFIVRDDVIITPPLSDNILEGITRKTLLRLADDMGIKVEERRIGRSELYFAEEVFLAGTGARVAPVVEIDRKVIGDGTVGPLSRALQVRYNEVVVGRHPQYHDWLVQI